jgi:hypothetical protein
MTFCHISCVFIHIPGPIFIFNIAFEDRDTGFGTKSMVFCWHQSPVSSPQHPVPKSAILNPARTGIFHSPLEHQNLGPRTLAPEFCRASFAVEMAWRLEGGLRTDMMRLTAEPRQYINLRYWCQGKSIVARAYKMSRREGATWHRPGTRRCEKMRGRGLAWIDADQNSEIICADPRSSAAPIIFS